MAAGIGPAIVAEVTVTTKQTAEVDPKISAVVVDELERRLEAKAKGFESKTAIGKLFGVQQPSVTKWFQTRRMSYECIKQAEEILGRDFLGDGRLAPESRMWAARWRALVKLREDGFALEPAYDAVSSQELDRSRGAGGWGECYDLARAALESRGPKVQPRDIPRPKGPPQPRRR